MEYSAILNCTKLLYGMLCFFWYVSDAKFAPIHLSFSECRFFVLRISWRDAAQVFAFDCERGFCAADF